MARQKAKSSKRKSYAVVGTGGRAAMYIHALAGDLREHGDLLWGKPQTIEYEQGNLGGHGGGDARLLRDLFVGIQDNRLGHAAGLADGAMSILTGIAANESFKTGLPVKIAPLVRL
jgi:hypothetical protein